MDRTTTSLVFVVENDVIVKDDPDVHVPELLPSSAGEGSAAKSCSDRAPEAIEAAELNWGDQRYMLDPPESENEPAP